VPPTGHSRKNAKDPIANRRRRRYHCSLTRRHTIP